MPAIPTPSEADRTPKIRRASSPLTEVAIKAAKPAAAPFKLSDQNGLYLLVTPPGSKLWRWKYRFLGKEKLMSLGSYPLVTLKQARELHEDARRQLAAGLDPMEERKAEKTARRLAVENSFAAVARLWWASWKAARSESHTDYVMRRLTADVFPVIGARPIDEIQPLELVRMMKRIEARGALDIAKRAHQTCGQIFRYAIAHGLASRNPSSEIRPSDVLSSRKKQNYARIEAKELPELLRRIDVYQGGPTTRSAMKLMAMTFGGPQSEVFARRRPIIPTAPCVLPWGSRHRRALMPDHCCPCSGKRFRRHEPRFEGV